MEKINPSNYITDVDPVDEPIMVASDWYATETKTLTDQKDQIPWLLAQGWTITDSSVEQVDTPTMKIDGETVAWITRRITTTEMERRTLKSEFALNQLIESFTNAYNAGRTLNDSRYDELVTLYSVMLDKTEDEIIANTDDDPEEYTTLIDSIIATMNADYEDVKGDLDGALDEYGDAQRGRVGTQFDNQLTTTRADLIARGLYNTTVWDTLSAGIERERAFALTDLEDSIVDRQLSLRGTIYGFKETLNTSVLEAKNRLRTQLKGEGGESTSLRNQAFQAMLSFMERREDGYPDLSAIAGLTSNLGATATQIQAP